MRRGSCRTSTPTFTRCLEGLTAGIWGPGIGVRWCNGLCACNWSNPEKSASRLNQKGQPSTRLPVRCRLAGFEPQKSRDRHADPDIMSCIRWAYEQDASDFRLSPVHKFCLHVCSEVRRRHPDLRFRLRRSNPKP